MEYSTFSEDSGGEGDHGAACRLASTVGVSQVHDGLDLLLVELTI